MHTDGDAKRKEFIINSELLSKINNFCNNNKISNYNFFMSVYSIYLGRVSNLNDFAIGTPVLNRTNFAEKNTTGMFINTVPLKININPELTFIDFAKSVATNSIGMLRHQKYTYQQLLSDLRKKNNSLTGLYDFMVSYQVTKANDKSSTICYDVDWLPDSTIGDGICVHLHDNNDLNSLNIDYDYQIDKYSEKDIENIHSRILNMIDQILTNDAIVLKSIEIVTPSDKKHILNDFNNTKVNYPKNKTIAELFEEQVVKTPNHTAVIFGNTKLTYKELNEKANSLAYYLRKQNVGKNDLIGVMANRSLEIIVSILAILKAGGAYIPIDPTYPQNRIEYMLNSGNAKFLLTQKHLKDKVSFANKLFIDLNNTDIYNLPSQNLKKVSTPQDLAYVIFTSGSTGNPKGVMLMQKNIVNFIFGMMKEFKFSNKCTIASITTISFDIFVLESLMPLLNGLKIVIANEDEQTNVKLFNNLCLKNKVDVIQTTPSRMMSFLTDTESLDFVKNATHILIGGEPFPVTLFKKFKNITNAKIYNMYGPTETAVWSSLKHLISSSEITVGLPISNTQFYILDKNLNVMPTYTPGELYISGDGVCKGYLNRDDLTTKSFIPNPFIPGTIMYNTGDLGMYKDDGEIICLGRSDFQVKIRGLRLELGEIEDKMSEIPEIASCAVIKWTNTNSHEYLCAYYTTKSKIEISDIRKYLEKYLPSYMIPECYMQMDALPHTPNGKTDKKALPEPQNNIVKANIIPPRNDIDTELVNIFKDLLKLPNVSIDSSFFELGGDSLSAISLSIKIQNIFKCEIFVRDILEHPSIQELSDIISKNQKQLNIPVINKAENMEYYPVSSAQRRIYFASQAPESNSSLYNIPGGVLLDGTIDIDLLEACFKSLIKRHESLRTYFEVNDENVVQKIKEDVDFNLDIIKAADIKYLDNIFEDFVRPFDLNKAPLFRARYIQFIDGKSALLLDMHHIISDGRSLNIFIDELCKLYNGITLPELNISYKDFSIFENKMINDGKLNKAEEFWLHQFDGEIPILNMPTNYPRPAVKSYEGKKIYLNLDLNLTKTIERLCKELGITPYMLLLSCYYILLSKYTSQDDIIIGSPIIGRNLPQTENLIGMFVNTLAIKEHIDSSLSIKDFMLSFKDNLLEIYKYQSYPFDKLVNLLNIKRDTSRNPLFDIMFVYQNNGFNDVNFGDIKSEFYIPDTGISKFDLTLEAIPNKTGMKLSFEYAVQLFNEDFINNLSKHYLNVLNIILKNADTKISDICVLSEEEKNLILHDFNNTKTDFPKDKTIAEIFEEQVQKNPYNNAVIFENEKITYKELNEKANSLANHLIELGITNNDTVSILLNRSFDLIIAIYAVIKSGASYVLIDSTFPKDRINYIISNSNSKYCIVNNLSKNQLESDNYINIDEFDYLKYNNENISTKCSSNLCYIYTSGSTGNPKGVSLHQIGFINLIYAFDKEMEISKAKNILGISTVSFDMFAVELFSPLFFGNTLVLANEEEQKNAIKMSQLIKDNNIGFLLTTPSRIELLLLEECGNPLTKVKAILLGGEKFSGLLYEKIHSVTDAKIFNGYGPTEISACCSIKEVTSNDVTIGKPLSNTEIYICDSNLNLLPVGIAGEICVGGIGVANGYLNNKTATEKSFLKNPFNEGFLYRTGDLGRYRNNGEIEFIGRSDFQVKIRGLRIELGEIESLIMKYPNIQNAVVIKQEIQNREFISAYYVSTKRIVINELRKYLSGILPAYMIPSYFIPLDKLPQTLNGKVDRKALPISDEILKISNEEYIAPRTDLQQRIVSIWEKILNTSPIGINDNFFELGGDSLLAMNLNIELLKLSNNLKYSDMFRFPTVAEQAEKIMSNDTKPIFSKIENLSDNYVDILKNCTKKDTIKTRHPKNILLTGATGFLGIHVLEEIIKNETCNIYCIVRDEPGISSNTKLHQKLNYYFGNLYDDLIDKRIFTITGNITEQGFGLNQEELLDLANSIDVLINCAARVTHYGNYNDFYNSNVRSVRYMIDFCNSFHKTLYHVSTIGISDLELDTSFLSYNKKKWWKRNSNNEIIFDESCLYIGQSLNNVYARSKFEAESYILDAISKGLDGYILRMGNLMPRARDGVFQENILDNAFINRFISFMKIGIIPENMLKIMLDFSPIDYAAKAVYKLITHPSNKNRIFHLFNHKEVPVSRCIKIFKKINYDMKVLSSNDFANKISEILGDETSKLILKNLINDFDNDLHLDYKSDIIAKSRFTIKYLRKTHFTWSSISDKYLIDFVNLLRKVM